MPDLFQTVFGYVSDVLGETLFLVIFFVQAAGLAQLALDKQAKEQPRGPMPSLSWVLRLITKLDGSVPSGWRLIVKSSTGSSHMAPVTV